MHGNLFRLLNKVLVLLIIFYSPLFTNFQSLEAQNLEISRPYSQNTSNGEKPSPYYDSILYSEIGPLLDLIQKKSDRVMVDIIGQSQMKKDLYLVMIAAPGEEGRFGHYKKLRKLMISNPEKALEFIDEYDDFKVPVFINGSIHGDEYPGTDACIQIIKKLAFGKGDEVEDILENIILLINVVQNPDGRISGTRRNSKGFDINRDFLTQSQPETKATVQVITEWNPMVFLDLHGFVAPMLIEPCTPPHNPNYEYDLYIKWAYDMALSMEESLVENTSETEAIIPFRDWAAGWDDYPPIYAAMYPILHGGYGHTLETPYRDERGVEAHVAAVWGALNFIVENKEEMILDQIEVYRRGYFDMPQVLISDDILSETPFNQFNELTLQSFPKAYIIPTNKELQSNRHSTIDLLGFLLKNGVQVEKASKPFQVEGTSYPEETFVVYMNQAKRGMANTILEDGLDVSSVEGLTFYSPPASWSHPLLWGVSRKRVENQLSIETTPITTSPSIQGTISGINKKYFALSPDSNQSFKAINDLISKGEKVHHTQMPQADQTNILNPGLFVLESISETNLKNLIDTYKLSLSGMDDLPANTIRLTHDRIAVYGDEGLSHALETLGFSHDRLSSFKINEGIDLSQYSGFIFSYKYWEKRLTGNGKANLKSYINQGGDFIGVGIGGIDYAFKSKLFDFDYMNDNGNGIIKINYKAGHSLSSGFASENVAFINTPIWFTKWEALDQHIVASIAPSDFFISGYWPDWKMSEAKGMPVVLFKDGSVQDICLMGIDPSFRGHPKNTFRLIGNAIFSSQENL